MSFVQRYAFKKKKWLVLAKTFDWFGSAVKSPPLPSPFDPKKILVARLDQLGDIVQVIPLLAGLRERFPKAELVFLTTQAGRDILVGQNLVDDFIIWNCPWFDSNRKPNKNAAAIRKIISERSFDCAFDPRGDVRLSILFRRCGIKYLIGYGATGGGFLLNANLPWDPAMHAIDKNLRLLEIVCHSPAQVVPKIQASSPDPVSFDLAVHPDAGAPSKVWPIENFVQVINTLKSRAGFKIVLIGTNEAMGRELAARVGEGVENRMGQTTVPQLIDLLCRSRALLTNDSGPAHVMAALGKPVWIVWSGVADPLIWSPRGSDVKLFQHAVPCSPCSLRKCPVPGHPCVTSIPPESVISSLLLKANT